MCPPLGCHNPLGFYQSQIKWNALHDEGVASKQPLNDRSGNPVQTNTADASPGEHSGKTLWLIAHERDDPMLLNQTEYADTEATRVLERILTELVSADIHVDPPFAPEVIGRRYDVHDKDGWLATYWLCEEQVSADDGMLTAIVSPGALQRAHHTVHRT